MVCYYVYDVFLYLSSLLNSGFLQFKGNFIGGQNNLKYCESAPPEPDNSHSPLNLIQEQVQRDWIMLITSPWIEARMVGGPVETRRVTR